MDQNSVMKFCDEFVNLPVFGGIRDVAPSVFASNPSSETLIAIMDAHAKTVLELYILSLCKFISETSQSGDLADQLFRGVN